MEFRKIDDLMPGYLTGDLTEKENIFIEEWRKKSLDHEKYFQKLEAVWNAIPQLNEMEQFNSFKALKKINSKIEQKPSESWAYYLLRIAAILIIPLLLYSGYLTIDLIGQTKGQKTELVWQTYSTPPGVKAKIQLPDGSTVWLNSSSEVAFPIQFANDHRKVKITGEAFFDIQHKEDLPFFVELGKLNIKVLGTRFNVINYKNENRTEVILQTGKIMIGTGSSQTFREIAEMTPNDFLLYNKTDNNLILSRTDANKHMSWIDGKLIFRDDTMDEVVRRLNRFFNVNIEIRNSEILDYVYTATFQYESLDQILELLCLSAPLRYEIIPREKEEGGLYSCKQIILKKR